jgi:anti-sigma B factor antagonist
VTPLDDSAAVSGTLDMRVRTDHPRAVVLDVTGEVDAASVEILRQELNDLADAGHADIVLDLTMVTFLDSAGLGALVAIRRRLQSMDGALVLVCGNDIVLRVFKLTGLDRVMPIYPTPEGALATEFAG